jgi:hypothetical protein
MTNDLGYLTPRKARDVEPKVLAKLRDLALRRHGLQAQSQFCQQRAQALYDELLQARRLLPDAERHVEHLRVTRNPKHEADRARLEETYAAMADLDAERARLQEEAAGFNSLAAPMGALIAGIARHLQVTPTALGLIYDDTPQGGSVAGTYGSGA